MAQPPPITGRSSTLPCILLLDSIKPIRITPHRTRDARGNPIYDEIGAPPLKSMLEREGYYVLTSDAGQNTLDLVAAEHVDLIIQDLLPADGRTFLQSVKLKFRDIPCIVLSSLSTFLTPFEAMRLGAYTYVKKPFDNDEMREVVARALKHRSIRRDVPAGIHYVDIVSSTPVMARISSQIDRVALTDSTVLITGESGTGKDLAARAIHFCSSRAKNSFIPVYCGAFAETFSEPEIFAQMKGFFKSADRGTLFLDEVGELTLPMQAKLLCVLESRSPNLGRRAKETSIDVRIIASTNRKLGQMALAGQFREELYYRLNVVTIDLPPLRERKDDIPLLAGHFAAKFAKSMGKQIIGIDDEVIEKLMSFYWPGNVRQFENTMESAVAISRGDRIKLADIALPATPLTGPLDAAVLVPPPVNVRLELPVDVPMAPFVLPEKGFDLERHILDHRRALILQALDRSNWSLTEAGKLLNVSFRTIRYQVSKLGIEIPKDDKNDEQNLNSFD